MSDEIKRRKIDVLYDDVVGDVRTLLDGSRALCLSMSEAEGRLRAAMHEMNAASEAATSRLTEVAGKVEATTSRSIQEEGRKAAATAVASVMAAASEAVTHGAHQAALTAMAEPLHAMEKAYTEIVQKTQRLKDLADSINAQLTIRWEKALAIALAFFIVAASATIYIGRVLEARFPAYSKEDKLTLQYGSILRNAWSALDDRTQKEILRLGSASSD